MHWNCCDIASFPEEELQKIYENLTPSRKRHIDGIQQQNRKNCSLAAEALVLRLLKEYYDITDAKLHRGENGQPYLTGCALYVSISHCQQKVACAVSREPVGVDLERIRPVNLQLCRHICLAEEKAYLLGRHREYEDRECQDPKVLDRFFEIWTAKEAYFKKSGTGITNLKSVNILPLKRQIHRLEDYILQIL